MANGEKKNYSFVQRRFKKTVSLAYEDIEAWTYNW